MNFFNYSPNDMFHYVGPFNEYHDHIIVELTTMGVGPFWCKAVSVARRSGETKRWYYNTLLGFNDDWKRSK